MHFSVVHLFFGPTSCSSTRRRASFPVISAGCFWLFCFVANVRATNLVRCHLHKRSLHADKKSLTYPQKRHTLEILLALVTKRALHSDKRDLRIRKRALHIRKRAPYIRKRAIHIHKGALHSDNRDLHIHKVRFALLQIYYWSWSSSCRHTSLVF